jgi:trk system potassium uptake protein TrkH
MWLEGMKNIHPAKLLLLGYFLYVFFGWLLLLLPIARKGTVGWLDNLFTTVSAVSTAGLLTVDVTQEYTFFGQILILLLIQLGGLGYLTLSCFIVISTSNKLSPLQKRLSSESFSVAKISLIPTFIRQIVFYALFCEGFGAVWLSYLFWLKGVKDPVWNGIFHSVASFCTSGISLFPNSFIDFRYDFWINMSISTLCILGGIGFLVWIDIYKRMKGKLSHIPYTTRITLAVTFGFLILGTLLVFLTAQFPKELYRARLGCVKNSLHAR